MKRFCISWERYRRLTDGCCLVSLLIFLFALIERVWVLCSHQMPIVEKELLMEDV